MGLALAIADDFYRVWAGRQREYRRRLLGTQPPIDVDLRAARVRSNHHGPGRAIKEQEAANLANGNNLIPMGNVNTNGNANVKMIIPKERPEPTNK